LKQLIPGKVPLQVAMDMMQLQLQFATELVNAKANLNVIDNNGYTPFRY
jgi:hypothetical protein